MLMYFVLGSLAQVALNFIHMAMYFELKPPRALSALTGVCLLAAPILIPGYVPVSPSDKLWSMTAMGFAAYSSVIFHFFVFKGGYTRMLFGVLTVGSYNIASQLLIHSVYSTVIGWPDRDVTFWDIRLGQIAISLVAFPILYAYFRRPFRLILEAAIQGKWYMRMIFTMFIFITGYLVLDVAYEYDSELTMLLNFSTIGAIVAYYTTICLSIIQEKKNDFLNQTIASYEKLMPVYEHYAAMLGRKEKMVKTLSHDLRHALNWLGLTANEGDSERLAEYVLGSEGMKDEVLTNAHSDNPAVNAIVSFHFSQAKANGTECKAWLSIPQHLGLPVAELIMLMGNALENCVKATAPLGPEGRIEVAAKKVKDCLVLKTVNNYLPGTEKPGQGLGLESIRTLCERHDGKLDLEKNANEFRLTAILKLNA